MRPAPAVREFFARQIKGPPIKDARQSRLGSKGGIISGAIRGSKAEKEYRIEALRIAKRLCAAEPGYYLSNLNLSFEIAGEFPPDKKKALRQAALIPLIGRWRKAKLLPARAKKPSHPAIG